MEAINTDFKIGDNAVYPAHGVGVVKGIESREISGNRQTFYILQLLGKNMTVMVPTDSAKSVGLREVVSKRKVTQVFELLQERDVQLDQQTWNRRYRGYMEKMKTGSIFDIAEVMRDLCLLKREKELSFGERKMLDMAETLLTKELSIATTKTEAQVKTDIQNVFTDIG